MAIVPEPNACRWCGISEPEHYSRWNARHRLVPLPTQAQLP